METKTITSIVLLIMSRPRLMTYYAGGACLGCCRKIYVEDQGNEKCLRAEARQSLVRAGVQLGLILNMQNKSSVENYYGTLWPRPP